MAKTKVQKQQSLTFLEERLKGANSAVFATFTRMSIGDQEALRRSLKDAGINFTVFKKTLLQRALNSSGLNADIAKWEGNVGVATGQDEIAPAKIFVQSLKTYEGLQIRLGILNGKPIEEGDILELAELGGKDEVIARLIGTIAAPMRSLMGVLQANHRNLVSMISQIKNDES